MVKKLSRRVDTIVLVNRINLIKTAIIGVLTVLNDGAATILNINLTNSFLLSQGCIFLVMPFMFTVESKSLTTSTLAKSLR